jgi:hypothetical protein
MQSGADRLVQTSTTTSKIQQPESVVEQIPEPARPLLVAAISRGCIKESDVPEVLEWGEVIRKANLERSLGPAHIAEALQYISRGKSIRDVLRATLGETDARTGQRSGLSRRAEDLLQTTGEKIIAVCRAELAAIHSDLLRVSRRLNSIENASDLNWDEMNDLCRNLSSITGRLGEILGASNEGAADARERAQSTMK